MSTAALPKMALRRTSMTKSLSKYLSYNKTTTTTTKRQFTSINLLTNKKNKNISSKFLTFLNYIRNNNATTSNNFSTTTEEISTRPFRVLGLQQVAIGSLNKNALSSLWIDTFGCEKVKSFTSEKENVDEDVLTLGKGPFSVELDLMAPLDANKSPKVHIPSLNHIGLWVDKLEDAVEYLTKHEKMRFTPGGIRKGASGHNVVFIHPKGNEEFPKSGEGVLIELVQAPPEVIKAFDTTT